MDLTVRTRAARSSRRWRWSRNVTVGKAVKRIRQCAAPPKWGKTPPSGCIQVAKCRCGSEAQQARPDVSRRSPGRGDGADPFEMMAYPFEFADFPVFHFRRPALDTAANFAWHDLKTDETPELERTQKFALYPLSLERLPIQEHFLVHELSARSKERGAQMNSIIVVGPAATRISFGNLRRFRADIADQFSSALKPTIEPPSAFEKRRSASGHSSGKAAASYMRSIALARSGCLMAATASTTRD